MDSCFIASSLWTLQLSRSHVLQDCFRRGFSLCWIARPNSSKADTLQAFRPISRPTCLRHVRSPVVPLPSVLHARLLSSETKAAIDKAVASAPVVLFMKGTPETPQCGFSRASIQILGLQGVDPKKFVAFNVLEDPELRQGR